MFEETHRGVKGSLMHLEYCHYFAVTAPKDFFKVECWEARVKRQEGDLDVRVGSLDLSLKLQEAMKRL